MTKPLRRSLIRRLSRCALALAVGATSASAWSGELTNQLNYVDIPQQDVCRGNGCAVNTESYAFHKTQWRRWPGTPNVLPSPGRGDRAEAVQPRAQFDMPEPNTTSAPAAPRMQGTGVRAPRPAVSGPTTPRTTTPPEATSATGVPSGNESMPPINLEDILRDDKPAAPATTPESTTPGNEIPPPFDSKGSGGVRPRGSNRTISALSAGLNGRAPTKSPTPADPWQAAPARKVSGERSAPEGPTLNEPNLMSAPDDGPQLQATPDDPQDSNSMWKPVNETGMEGAVTPVANWQDAAAASSESAGGNPLRATGGAEGRRSNPLRRR